MDRPGEEGGAMGINFLLKTPRKLLLKETKRTTKTEDGMEHINPIARSISDSSTL